MALLQQPTLIIPSVYQPRRGSNFRPLPTIRSTLPFPPEKAKYYKELEAAVSVVEKACRLCVDVKNSLLSSKGGILEKNDSSPVTVADFGVQALISLELGKLFPSIPLVAEEDSTFLRKISQISNADGGCDPLDTVVNIVSDRVRYVTKSLTPDDVLRAIDRGGKQAYAFSEKPSTYWVLDPIDGTRAFLRESDAFYVVGLALVIEGELAIGVMGCPNWNEASFLPKSLDVKNEEKHRISGYGIMMIAHVGCGTWKRHCSLCLDNVSRAHADWIKCSVDEIQLLHEARICVPDSQTWESLPLSTIFSSTTDSECIRDNKTVHLLRLCCGSLCKYLMVASGRASVFILRTTSGTQTKAWDHAAGMICVYESGGMVTDWRGYQLDLAEDWLEKRIVFPYKGVLVTNGILHQEILDILSSDSLEV